jgi:AI-2 transport protein TqsA
MIGWKNYRIDSMHEHKEQNWLITISLVILAVVALGGTLMYTRTVMMPFVVALFIVALVAPIEDFQVRRLRLPRFIAVLVTLLFVMFIMAILSAFVVQAIRTIASTAQEYSSSFQAMADKLLQPVEYLYRQQEEKQLPADQVEYAPGTLPAPPVTAGDPNAAGTVDANAVTPPAAEPGGLTQRFRHLDTRQIVKDLADNAKAMIRDLTNHMVNILRNTVGAIFGLLSGVLFVCIFLIFLLAGRDPYAEHSQMYRDVVQRIRQYVGIHVLISMTTGVLVWATLAIMGLKLAGVFGVLAFVLNFIPSIGSIIVTLLPIPIAVVQFQSSPWMIVLVVALPGVIQNVLGNIIEPKLMGEGLDLHPVTILLALSFWGYLWGIMGMFLAAPITAALRIVLMQFDTFKPLGNLLAGHFPQPAATETKPASAPPEGTAPAASPRG